MKKCPFCAEEIQDAAIVCKHCHRDFRGHAAAASVNGFFQEIIDRNSTAKIVFAVLLICSVGAFLVRPHGEALSDLAFAGAWGAPTIGVFLLLPVKIGNAVLRFCCAAFLGFAVAAAGALLMRVSQ
jgi:hypothetical protein